MSAASWDTKALSQENQGMKGNHRTRFQAKCMFSMLFFFFVQIMTELDPGFIYNLDCPTVSIKQQGF